MNGETRRTDGKRTIVVVTILLLILDLALGALAVFVGPMNILGLGSETSLEDANQEPEADETPAPEPAPEPTTEPEPTSSREAPDTKDAPESHRVEPGDTLYDISKEVWGDEDLWPLIYQRNRELLDNPDQLTPSSTLALGPSPLAGGSITEVEKEELLDGFVAAYQGYRRNGEMALESGRSRSSEYLIQKGRLLVNKAHWLLYRGLVFDRDYLDEYTTEIQDRDRRVVDTYLSRFGLPSE